MEFTFRHRQNFIEEVPYVLHQKTEMVPGTLDAVMKLLSWSFNVLLSALTPFEDWLQRDLAGGGKYLADGWRAVLTSVRGDWEFQASLFNFPKWNTADNMCWLCKATPEGHLFRELWLRCPLAKHEANTRILP